MLFVNNNGIRISYRIDGQGPPIVLVHGGFGYKEMWLQMEVVDTLRNRYKLISIDLRGHGENDKPHDPNAYSMTSFVSDILAVLDDLDIIRTNYWGYSMGGWIGFGMVQYASERLISLICGGAQAHDEWTESWKSGWLKLFEQGDEAVLTSIKRTLANSKEPEVDNIQKFWLSSIMNMDLNAIKALMSHDEKLSLDKYLPNLKIPYLLYGGETDRGSWIGYEDRFTNLENCTLVSIPGGHILAALKWKPLQGFLETFLESHND